MRLLALENVASEANDTLMIEKITGRISELPSTKESANLGFAQTHSCSFAVDIQHKLGVDRGERGKNISIFHTFPESL
jgi:hypothetical protein